MTPAKTKAILRRLADDWRHEEAQLCKQFGDVIVPRSMRARRIKDTEAIYAAVEMIERLEAAESEAIEQARLNGMGAERELSLMAKLEVAEKERDEFKRACFGHISDNSLLRAKIAEMEKQEPVGKFIQHPSNGLWEQDGYGDNPDARPLYALPGAQGEEK